jgi:leucyl-tRNA synthetase
MVEKVGADALRVYEMFMGPFDQAIAWSFDGLVGTRKFLERVAGLMDKVSDVEVSPELEVLLNQTIKKVGDDIEEMKFNTAVSKLMILSNELGSLDVVPKSAYTTLLSLLAPFAPHLTEELWHELGYTTSIHKEPWQTFNSEKLTSGMVTIGVQIAGKTRGSVTVSRNASQEEVLALIKTDSKIAKYIPENARSVIYVPGKILNLIP